MINNLVLQTISAVNSIFTASSIHVALYKINKIVSQTIGIMTSFILIGQPSIITLRQMTKKKKKYLQSVYTA